MSALGIPNEYEAFIADSLTETVLFRLPWVSIQWQRVNRGVSAASVVLDPYRDNIACCNIVGSLRAWNQMLVIQRNGARVWDGLVTGWSTGSSVTINAYDRSVMLNKRLVGQDLSVPWDTLVDGYSTVIVPLLTDAGMFTAGVNQMPCNFELASPNYVGITDNIGAFMYGDWRVATLTSLGSIFQQFAGTGLNYTQRCEKFFVSVDFAEDTFNYGSVDDLGMLPALVSNHQRMVLTPSTTFVENNGPAVTIDANDIYTVGYGNGTGQGVAGFVNYTQYDATFGGYSYVPYVLQGVLSEAQTENFGVAVPDFSGNPITTAVNTTASPHVSLEQIQLAPTFGGDILKSDLSNLLPGIGMYIDYPESCALDAYHETFYIAAYYFGTATRISLGRLEDLSVSVTADASGVTESFTVSLTIMANVEGA